MADITPAMVRAAQDFDHEHRLKSKPWARVGNGQVRRLLAGALGPDSAVVPSGELVAFGHAMEEAQQALAAARAENDALRARMGAISAAEDAAQACERVRVGIEALKVTFWRPGNGPGQQQPLDVVPLEDLLRLLKGGPT